MIAFDKQRSVTPVATFHPIHGEKKTATAKVHRRRDQLVPNGAESRAAPVRNPVWYRELVTDVRIGDIAGGDRRILGIIRNRR